MHEPAAGDVTGAEHELDDLGRLQGAHDAGQNAENPPFRAGRHDAGRRRYRKQAAVAGAAAVVVHRQLPLESDDGCGDQRFAFEHAGIVDQVAGRKVVGAVGNDIVSGNDLAGVVAGQRAGVLSDLDVRVEVAKPRCAAGEFGLPYLAVAEQHLAMQVRRVDLIELDEPQAADAGRRKVHCQWRAEPAEANQQY